MGQLDGQQTRKIKPFQRAFQLPYRIATAGVLGAAVLGAAGAAALSWWRQRQGEKPLSGAVLAATGVVIGLGFGARYFPPYSLRRAAGNRVFLTFDDGPDPESTPAILDALAAHQARATFFLMGENAEKHPALVERLAAEGHSLGIHGFDHDPVTFLSASTIGASLDRTLDAIRNAPVRFYRPPFGLRGPGLGRALRRRGLKLILWTLDSFDYIAREPEPIRNRLSQSLKRGDIVLMHDAGETGRATAEALPAILDEIARRGWEAEGL